jgi:hypothetical protein
LKNKALKKYFSLTKALHLYFGLFISPFIFIFSISVLVLNHADYFNSISPKNEIAIVEGQLADFVFQETDLLTAKAIIGQLDITGEIDWISKTDSTFSFPVNTPGLSKRIFLNTKTGKMTIAQKGEGAFDAVAYLHTMPGQHNAMLRGNSFFMRTWMIATDVFVYIILFVSATGVFLWYFLRPERKLGIYSLAMGLLFFFALMIMLL